MKLHWFAILLLCLTAALLLTACGSLPGTLPESEPGASGSTAPPESENTPGPESTPTENAETPPEEYLRMLAAAEPEQYLLEGYVLTADRQQIRDAAGARLLAYTLTEHKLDMVAALCDATGAETLYRITYTCNPVARRYQLKYFDTQLEPPHSRGFQEPPTLNSDGTLALHRAQLSAAVYTYFLADSTTGKTKLIGELGGDSRYTEHGFFKNGDVYLMNNEGLAIYSGDCSLDTALFDTRTHFACGREFDPAQPGMERRLMALRREEDQQSYIVIYVECPVPVNGVYERLDQYYLACTYRVGILDAEGRLVQSWDTGTACANYVGKGFEPIFMYKISENVIEFHGEFPNDPLFRGQFDLATGIYTDLERMYPIPD